MRILFYVNGVWNWVSDIEVHWCFVMFFKLGTHVLIYVNVYGVQVGFGFYG